MWTQKIRSIAESAMSFSALPRLQQTPRIKDSQRTWGFCVFFFAVGEPVDLVMAAAPGTVQYQQYSPFGWIAVMYLSWVLSQENEDSRVYLGEIGQDAVEIRFDLPRDI